MNANASSATPDDLTVKAILYVPLKNDGKEPQVKLLKTMLTAQLLGTTL